MPCTYCGADAHNLSACPLARRRRVTINVLEDGDQPLPLVDLLLSDARLDDDGPGLKPASGPADPPQPAQRARCGTAPR